MPRAASLSVVLNFADSIDVESDTLVPDLRARIPFLTTNAIQAKERPAFEARGTELWNLATRRNRQLSTRDATDDGEEKTKIVLLRVFAFGMLDAAACSRNSEMKRAETCVRMLRVAFRTLKGCIGADELELAGKVAQRAAFWDEEAARMIPEDLRVKLRSEYFIWRMALAWKQDKIDIAEHMYAKFSKEAQGSPENLEDLADLLYELGKSLCDKNHYEAAVTWLERALDAIDSQELDRLSDVAGDLRLAIMQQLVKSLLMVRSKPAMDKARHVVGVIEQSYADKLISTILKLEIMATEDAPNVSDYFDAVHRMIRTIMLTRVNFKTIMHHIHKLKKLSAVLAAKALDELICSRLSQDRKAEWIERACVMRIWVATDVENEASNFANLHELLDEVHHSAPQPFTASAAHAAQTLLWSHIEQAYDQKMYDVAVVLCQLALHSLFEKCGELNRAKISRKMILCAIEIGDSAGARKVFFDLPEALRDAPETRHLMHKVALRDNDTTFAADCLASVARQAGKDSTRLYACVLDAIQLGNNSQAYEALSKILDLYGSSSTKGVHLPALLRCMIRLVKSDLRSASEDRERFDELFTDLCSLFETASKQAKRVPSTQNEFNKEEINWFSKNSYNVAIENVARIQPSTFLRLCLACNTLTEMLDSEIAPSEQIALRSRRITCQYLILNTLAVLARAEDNIEHSLDHYIAILKHGENLRHMISEQVEDDGSDEIYRINLMHKHTYAIKLELEASLRLRKWTDLPQLFEQCWKYENPERWDTLADLSFSIHRELCEQGPEVMQAHQRTVLQFVERIITKSWRQNEPIDKLAKHLRCFFHLTLGKEDGMAGHCMDQGGMCYPPVEIEWMVATAFNHAVTCFCVRDDLKCQFWAEKALMLAAHADDNGVLGGDLRKRYAQLRWDDK